MKKMVSIISFPGSNCTEDVFNTIYYSLEYKDVRVVPYKEKSIPQDTHLVIIPGGFSYGDVESPGLIASQQDIIISLKSTLEERNIYVLGICNGFQILSHANILPGKLVSNNRFTCSIKQVELNNSRCDFLRLYDTKKLITLPIAYQAGTFVADKKEYLYMKRNNMIAMTYAQLSNSDTEAVAGICNEQGNVLGMMPHPERACGYRMLFDGLKIFRSVL